MLAEAELEGMHPRGGRALYVDGLSFVEPGDLPRAGLSGAICDVSVHELAEDADLDDMASFRAYEPVVRRLRAAVRDLEAAPRTFVAHRGSDLSEAAASGRTACFLQIQGADPIGTELHRVDLLHTLGLRVLQLTHHDDNAWAGGCMSPTPTGLTAVGREGVARVEATGLVVDLAHASDATARDVLAMATRPVIVSHTGPRALVDTPRCAPDDVIRGVAESGGVVGVFMMSCWVTPEPEPTVDAYVRALRHVADVGGIECVGIANDYPAAGQAAVAAGGNEGAVGDYLPFWRMMRARGLRGFETDPRHVAFPELNRIDRMERIHDALLRAGFTSSEAELVMGRSWARVLVDVLG